jgi:hypothetical protein
MVENEFVFRGSLAETTLPEMLVTVHRYGVPGVMELSRPSEAKRIFFCEGDVIFATSSDREESLGDYLLSQGTITKAQYEVSSAELVRSPGKRHGSILVQMGFISQEELGAAVREQVQSILWNVFNWEDGTVNFRVGQFRDDEVYKIKIPTPRVVLSGCKRITDTRLVMNRLGSRRTVFQQLPRPSHLKDFHLDSTEQQLLDMVDGKRKLQELCEKGPLSPGVNARALYALFELQLVGKQLSAASGIRIQVRDSTDS